LRRRNIRGIPGIVKGNFVTSQDQYDDAMFDYSTGDYDQAIAKFTRLLELEPANFDAQCALSMCFYRKEDYLRAIEEGKKAEVMRPKEQLVHTNLSLFYMKAGDKKTAEHHGLQARVASWRDNMAPPGEKPAEDPDLAMAQPKPPPIKLPSKLADAPWKKKPSLASGDAAPSSSSGSSHSPS
jgi:tetratricopeptide (TPR) repeat protein